MNLKRFLFVMVVAMFSVLSYADNSDIILTRSRQQIHCFIISETDSEVKYMSIAGSDPTTYTISKSDILQIYRASDAPKVAENNSTTIVDSVPSVATTIAPTPSPIIEDVPKPETTQPSSDKLNISTSGLNMIAGQYYINGEQITTKELQSFYMKNCPEAYEQYRRGNNMCVGGLTVMCVGAVAEFVGLGVVLGAQNPSAGLGITIGSAVVALGVGLPIACVGLHKRSTAYDVYRQSCKQTTATLKLNVSTNGLGLAFNF